MDGYVLVVDDDHAILRVLVDLLEDEGFDARPASSAFEALELCEREAPALLITDLDMPGMDGAGLVSELDRRRLEAFPVIVVSGRDDLVEQARTMSVHAVPKPVEFDRLLRRVRLLLPPVTTSCWTTADAPIREFRSA